MKSNLLMLLKNKLVLLLPVLALALNGCATQDNGSVMAGPPTEQTEAGLAAARFHVGDTVTITYDGGSPDSPLLAHEEIIKEDGAITLPYIGSIKAANRTAGELQESIVGLYVPRYYLHLTVTVKAGDRVFFVRGEVVQKGRQIYSGQMTVTKAITSAGDFTDYANRKKVWITRANGQRFKVNCDAILSGQAPDPPVYPGDQIEVSRRWL